MASSTEAPVDLYIAAYGDPSAAQRDWDGVKQLAKDNVIDVEGMVLVSRNNEGKIDVKDDAHDVRKGGIIGAVAGAAVGLIFPPSILGGAIVGALAGGGIGGLRDHRKKTEIKDDVEEVLPPNSSGIVVMFKERWADEIEAALEQADSVTKHEVDPESAQSMKTAVEKK